MGGEWVLRFGAVLAFGALASCGGTPLGCRHSCPRVPVTLLVTDATSGAVSTVEATLSNGTTETQSLSCEARADGTGCTFSAWPTTPGSYSFQLQVTAPGFKTATVPATVTVSAEPACGCVGATLEPSTLTLDRS